ncbi:hypothetical protein RND81_02G151800 [Saponaria officinalis]|uniref:Pentatricopeptide repeat-containing protein n=1 Tax=Saponaria officinalis TaxID=3572 RepID=A0AAW1MW22_SAPOF
MSGIIAAFNPYYLLQFHFRRRFRFLFHSLFICRNYSARRCNDVVDNRRLFLQSVREQCRLRFSSVEIPVSIFDQLNSLRPRPSIIDFCMLFTAMSKIKPHPPLSTVITFCNQLELSGLRPDRHSVSILANCYCRLGRVDFAFSLLGKHIKLGYPPDVVITNTLLNGLIASDKLRSAVQLLDKIVKLGIQPTLDTYGAMFKGLCLISDNVGALRLLRNMKRKAPFKPNIVI